MTMTMRANILRAGAVFLATAILAACGGGGTPEGRTAYERENDFARGDPNAPVTFTEYASTSCPACAAFHAEVMPMIEREFIETGQVRLVFREMLTSEPRLATAGFMLARCLPEDRYFDMISVLFRQQRAIFDAASRGGARDEFLTIARSLGMSTAQFNECLNNDSVRQDVIAAHDRAVADGIGATPSFLINGRPLNTQRHDGGLVYTLGNQRVMIDGEPVPAFVDVDTYRRLLAYAVREAGGEAPAAPSPAPEAEPAPDPTPEPEYTPEAEEPQAPEEAGED